MSDDVKKLYRTREDRMVGGVCSGLAVYFNVDPTLIRIIFVALAFIGGGFLLYLLFWIFIPDEPNGSPEIVESEEMELPKEEELSE